MSENNFHNDDVILDIHDRPKFFQGLGLSLQHLFTMFGATVLVPILVGINPAVALLSSGLGTLVHLTVTKGKIPAYMGSSFAYIAAMQLLMKHYGFKAVALGAMTTGIVYVIVAIIVKKAGSKWLDKILPSIVVGPVVMVIGLGLASNAAQNAMYRTVGHEQIYDVKYVIVALITCAAVIFFNMYMKGFLGLIPVLLGIVVGYLVSLMMGIVDVQPIIDAKWFSLPPVHIPYVNYQPKFYLEAITVMAPIAFVTMTEHIGHLMVLNKITNRNFYEDPGLHRTLLGDGLAQITAGFVGGPPVTSYGENIGVMTLTKVHSVYVIAGAAIFAILLGFIGKITALIQSIPTPVIGGISFILFGVIASSGLRIMIDSKIDLDEKRNLIIASAILVIGIGGLILQVGTFALSGMALATVVGIVLNLILPKKARSEQ